MNTTGAVTRTKVDGTLAAAERRFANDPERAALIACTRRFKASWIELAELLTNCQRQQRYTRWGFASFEEYFRRELHLKTSTVNKLVGTYAFLRKTEPRVLERDGIVEEFPSLQSVDFLRKATQAAEERGASPELLGEVRRAILDDNLPATKVARQFRETLFGLDSEVEQQKQRREAMRQAQRLAEVLPVFAGSVPDKVLAQVRTAIERLLGSIDSDEKAQAA